MRLKVWSWSKCTSTFDMVCVRLAYRATAGSRTVASHLGERTPVGVRLAGPPANIPEHWNMCHTARKFRAAVSSSLGAEHAREHGDDETISTRKLVERRDGSRVEGEW